ncbi:MAG: hypothetical protein AAF467_27680 [Actinomycetota bacterium]
MTSDHQMTVTIGRHQQAMPLGDVPAYLHGAPVDHALIDGVPWHRKGGRWKPEGETP